MGIDITIESETYFDTVCNVCGKAVEVTQAKDGLIVNPYYSKIMCKVCGRVSVYCETCLEKAREEARQEGGM